MRYQKSRMSGRRRFVKVVGSAATLSGVGVVGADEPTSKELFEQALRIQEETGDREQVRQFLRNHGFGVAYKTMTWEIPSNSHDGVSTDKLDKNDLVISLDLYEDCTDYYGKVTWNWGNNDLDDIGDDPKDNIGMTYKEDAWLVPSGGVYGGNFIANVSDYDYSANGVGVRYSDGKDLEVFGAGGADRWFAADLEPLDDTLDPQERQLWAVYQHNYAGGVIDSVGFTFGVISVSFDTGAKSWGKGTDENGNKLILNAADAAPTC